MATTKIELENTLTTVADKVAELLNPALSREAIVEGLQQLDENLNSDDDDDADDDIDDDDDAL